MGCFGLFCSEACLAQSEVGFHEAPVTGGVGGAGVDYWARPRKRSRVAAGDGGGGGAAAAAAGAMGVEQQQPSETLWGPHPSPQTLPPTDVSVVTWGVTSFCRLTQNGT